MLAPRWWRVRVGPYLRRERDKRRYDVLFRPSGWRDRLLRSAALVAMRRHPEPSALESRPEAGGLYLFRGLTGGFAPFVSRRSVVRSALLATVRPAFLPAPAPEAGREPFIAVHVRRGDFSLPSSTELHGGGHNYRIPIEWYVGALRALRAAVGRAVPTLVFSDGSEAELAPLLSERRTALSRDRHAIVDLLKMSESGALIASGSTFSMWASFLGQVPAVWHPGQRRELLLGDRAGTLEPEWSRGDFSGEFVRAVRGRLNLV